MEVLEFSTKSPKYKQRVYFWARISLTSTVVTNLLATGLIFWKIWQISRSVNRVSRRMNTIYVALVRASIESGSIFTVVILTWLILNVRGAIISWFFSYLLPIAIGVAPTLCVVKIQLLADHSMNNQEAVSTTPVVAFTEPIWQQGYSNQLPNQLSNQLSTLTFAPGSDKISNNSMVMEGSHGTTLSRDP